MSTRLIDREEVRTLVGKGAQLAEVLPQAEYDFEHIAGAVHVPLEDIEHAAADRLDITRPVIVYCNDFL